MGGLFGVIACATPSAHAFPTFQVYIDAASAADALGEDDTWFSTANPVTLVVVGAYGPNTTNLSDVTLMLSVPEGEIGTLSFSDLGNGIPPLLSVAGTNPILSANENHLSDVGGNDGYNEKDDFAPFGMNNHAPTGDGTSDFLLYSLGSFNDDTTGLYNYDADDGSITFAPNATGQEKRYSMSLTGFSRVHFDVYGFETRSRGQSGWEQNPGSHDSTWTCPQGEDCEPPPPPPPLIPEPSSLLLLSGGWLGLLRFGGSFKRQRMP